MARNVFVSYKYGDIKVPDLNKTEIGVNVFGQLAYVSRPTRVRDYVDELQEILNDEDNINLGEKDGESLAEFKESTIRTALKKKIFRSSVTIVMISKGMVDPFKIEIDQWIPWEISYSLRQITRDNGSSRANAILGIVLPDENNSYDWYLTYDADCNCTNHNTSILFKIIRDNMFNQKYPTRTICKGQQVYSGDYSYIPNIRWDNFKTNPNYFLDKSIEIRDKIKEYDVHINLD